MARTLRKREEFVAADYALSAKADREIPTIAVPTPTLAAARSGAAAPSGKPSAEAEPKPPQRSPERLLQGHIDLAKWPRVKGWVWDPKMPGQRVRLEIAEDDKRVLAVIASLSRPDLAIAGIGDGLYGFDIDLDDTALAAGRHLLQLRCAETGAELPGAPIVVEVPASAPAKTEPAGNGVAAGIGSEIAVGEAVDAVEAVVVDAGGSSRAVVEPSKPFRCFIDEVSDNGVSGWIVVRAHPSRRCIVMLRERDRLLSRADASQFRPDLLSAGIGDGCHAFTLPMPRSLLDGEEHLLEVVEQESGLPLNDEPICWRSAAGTGDKALAVALAIARPSVDKPSASSAQTSAAVPESRGFQGFVDGVDAEWRLSGWACDSTAAEPLTVELVEGETVLATARAVEFRDDLLAAGLRDGNCAFYIRVPAKLFDGKFRNLQVYGRGDGRREPIGKPFGIVFPRLGRLHSELPAAIPAIDIFEQVSGRPAPSADRPGRDLIDDTSAVLEQLGERFGHAAAMGLLYAYVLRRPIDNDGLATRLTRIHSDASAYNSIVQEVMYSEEAGLIHGPSKYLSLHPLEFLRVWLDGRFGILELPA